MARQERSAGFIVFHRGDKSPQGITFLLLDYGRHWDYPKGHVEKGEDDFSAARRELKEETGITEFHAFEGFRQEVTYYFRHPRHGLVRKTVVFFIAEVFDKTVAISNEHQGHAFVTYEDGLRLLSFSTAKNLLKAAWLHLGHSSPPAGEIESVK